MSARGLCSEDGWEKAEAQQWQLNAKAGPLYRDWQRKMARSIGLILPEDVSSDRET